MLNGMSEAERALRDEIAVNYEVMRAVKAKFDRGADLTAEDRARFDAADNALTQAKEDLDDVVKSPSGIGGLRHLGKPESRENRAWDSYLRTGDAGEYRATLSAMTTAPTSAGYTVPEGFWAELSIALKAYSGFHQFYKQLETPTGNPMPWATNDPTSLEAEIIGETSQVGDTTLVFGQGLLRAWAFDTGAMRASLNLIQDSAYNIEEFVTARSAEIIGRKVAAMSAAGAGAGSKQPTGIYPALTAKGVADGASGGYVAGAANTVKVPLLGNSDGVTEAGGNVLSPATIQAMVKAVDPAYYEADGGAAWYVSNDQLVNLRNIADQYGRPLYPELRQSTPTLESFPVRIVQAASALTADTVSGPVFGNLSHAMVRRVARDATLMVLTERYIDYLEYGYIAYMREDHQADDLRAAVTVKPPASS